MRIDSLPHRKWKVTKPQPGTAGPGNMLGCCLISFHFLWGKLSTCTVLVFVDTSPTKVEQHVPIVLPAIHGPCVAEKASRVKEGRKEKGGEATGARVGVHLPPPFFWQR